MNGNITLPQTATPPTPSSGNSVLGFNASGELRATQPDGTTKVIGAFLCGRGADLTVSSTGTTTLSPATSFLQWFQKVTFGAGSGGYTAGITLGVGKALPGAIFRLALVIPASLNPTVGINDGGPGGAELFLFTNTTGSAMTILFSAYFDGANWNTLSESDVAVHAQFGAVSHTTYMLGTLDCSDASLLAFTATDTQSVGFAKVTAPSAPAANKGVLFLQDNGSGKMQLAARFPTGAVQVIATEP